MTRIVPELTTGAQAEAFLEQDLSDLDFGQFTPAAFEFQPKAAQPTLRMPQPLLDAALARGEGARLGEPRGVAATQGRRRGRVWRK
jgi:predicted DNA binding CopG/RHH family protein